MGRRIIDTTSRPTILGVAPKESELEGYLDRLKNLIPAEVSAAYIAVQALIPSEEKVGLAAWAAACLILTFLFIASQSKTEEGNPGKKHPINWGQVGISSISFVIWVYALGGPFASFGIRVPWIGFALMVGWTLLVPMIYRGAKE
jgi:hypothetical protein